MVLPLTIVFVLSVLFGSFLSLFLGDSFFSIVLLISLLSLFLIFLVYEIGLNQNERKKIVEFIKTKIDR